MPTTLTLDDDLARLLSAEAQQKGRSIPEIATALLRTALAKPAFVGTSDKSPFRIQPHRGTFAPGVNLKKLNRLADELDTGAFLTRQGGGS